MTNAGLKKAFFLDRDGTVNIDTGYVGNPDSLALIPGAAQAIKELRQAGYLAVIVSNQSGVARGYFNMNAVHAVNDKLNELLADSGTRIDAFYICPHYHNGTVKEYAVDCSCRKPKLELYRKAIEELGLDPAQCAACGDKFTDIERLAELGLSEQNLGLITDRSEKGCYKSLLQFTLSVLGRQR